MLTVTCQHCNKTDFDPGSICKACGVAYDDATQARINVEALKRLANQGSEPSDSTKRLPSAIILTTTNEVPGRTAVRALGIVTAEVVIGANIFRDFFASLTDVLGGRSHAYQSVLRKAKLQAQSELRNEAFALGADAIVGIAFDYSEISGDGKSMLFLVMSGTAVKLEPTAQPRH